MAVEMSPRLLKEFSFSSMPVTHLRVKTRRVFDFARQCKRALVPPLRAIRFGGSPAISHALEAQSADFQHHGYGFIDPFFDEAFATALREGWPPRHFFSAMHNVYKSYDFGFRWLRNTKTIPYLTEFPCLEQAYQLLRSGELAERVSLMCGDGIARSCYSLTASWASAGSALISHRDSVAHDAAGQSFINIVIFVDGNGVAPHGGGTCISADNEYRRILFEPTKLRNTALVYRSQAEFFHGFKPMASNTYRWTINAQFCDVNYNDAFVD